MTTPTTISAAGEPGPAPWAGHQQAEPHLFLDPPAPNATGRYRMERRLAILAGRFLLYATLAVVLVAGLKTIVTHPTEVPALAQAGTATAFPAETATAVASEFTAAYLTWPAGASPDQWRQNLAPYLAAGVNVVGGWDGSGSQTVTTVMPAGTEATGLDTAVVTVAARLASGSWIHLAVPVAAHDGTVAVTGPPAFVPGSARPGPLPAAAPLPALENDSQAAAEATDTLGKFFAAYGAGDRSTLAYLTTPATPTPSGLGGTVTLAGIDGVTVAAGPGPVREGRVTVRWALPAGGSVTQPYALRLEQRDGRWYIAGPPQPFTPTSVSSK